MNLQNNKIILEEIAKNRTKYLRYLTNMLKNKQYGNTAEDILHTYCLNCMEVTLKNSNEPIKYLSTYIYKALYFLFLNTYVIHKRKEDAVINDLVVDLPCGHNTDPAEALDNAKNKNKFIQLCETVLARKQKELVLSTLEGKELEYKNYNTMKHNRRLAVEKLRKGVKEYGIEIFK